MTGSVAVTIAESVGGPSPVAVIPEESLPSSPSELVNTVQSVVTQLGNLGHMVSKCAVASPLSDNDAMTFRSIQVRGIGSDGKPMLETGKDCGNSMIASALVGLLGKYGTAKDSKLVEVRNTDTGFTTHMHTTDGDAESVALTMAIPSVAGKAPAACLLTGQPQWYAPYNGEKTPVSTLDIVNPYIIVDARALGIDAVPPLLQANPGDQLLQSLQQLRLCVRDQLFYPPDSEFPKIAVARRLGTNIVARTLYRTGWHPGLPITASITLGVAAQVPGSVLDTGIPEQSDTLTINTPGESIPLHLQVSAETGLITTCAIKDRRAILRQNTIRIAI